MKSFFNSLWNFTNVEEPYYELNNVYVHHATGLIFDSQGKPIFKFLYEFLYWQPAAIRSDSLSDNSLIIAEVAKRYVRVHEYSVSLIEKLSADSKIDSFDEFVYLLHCFGWYAFGHLQDTTMRLYSLPRELELFQKNILCSDFRRISDFDQHLLALGCDPEKIVDRRFLSEFIFVERLHVGVNPATPTNYTADSYKWMVACYKDRFVTNSSSLPGLYLSRNHVRPGERGVLNNDEVIDYLEGLGYIVLDGTEPLKLVVDYFSRAEVVVGAHGSLLAHSVYCKRSAKIIEYCPKSRVDFSFKNKYKLAEDYNQILLESDDNYNIYIDIVSLSDLL